MHSYAGRCKDVEDEEAKERAQQQAALEAEAKRDAVYEEFKAKYEDHIEGKAPNDRLDRVSNFDNDNKSTRSKSARGGKREKSNASGRDEGEEQSASRAELKSSKSQKSNLEHQEEINRKFDEERMALPETCFVQFAKSAKIEKLEAKYLLVAHPYPQVEGEMLIMQPKKDDQPEKDLICYRDYSLRNRMVTREKPQVSAAEQLRMKKDKKLADMSKLQCLEIDLGEPLCQTEWHNMSDVINQTSGLAWFQILPAHHKSVTPFQFNAIHVLPQAKIPVARLPIERHIANVQSFNKKTERKAAGQPPADKEEDARAQLMDFARQQGLLMVPEFHFEHVIYMLTESVLSSDGLIYAYQKCSNFMHLRTKQDLGLTVLVTPKWMMLAVLTAPYLVHPSGLPSYLDGFAFTGLVNLQNVEKQWPRTADSAVQQIGVLEAFEKSTRTEKVTSVLQA